ncbi:MAG: Rpn family recombination-promoting nuclease/putative transposase, partial [Acidobacteriota bacterium]
MGQLDAGYRTLFSHPYLVESLISGFLPEQWTEGLDYSSLETVSEAHATETWSMRYNDRVWRLRKRAGGWIYFYLMLEFQSTNEHFMALRTLSYVGVLYQHLRKSLELRPRDLLPTVLPLVLYHGASRWTATTQVFDLIEPAGP